MWKSVFSLTKLCKFSNLPEDLKMLQALISKQLSRLCCIFAVRYNIHHVWKFVYCVTKLIPIFCFILEGKNDILNYHVLRNYKTIYFVCRIIKLNILLYAILYILNDHVFLLASTSLLKIRVFLITPVITRSLRANQKVRNAITEATSVILPALHFHNPIKFFLSSFTPLFSLHCLLNNFSIPQQRRKTNR